MLRMLCGVYCRNDTASQTASPVIVDVSTCGLSRSDTTRGHSSWKHGVPEPVNPNPGGFILVLFSVVWF
jgi:hypothetical protein